MNTSEKAQFKKDLGINSNTKVIVHSECLNHIHGSCVHLVDIIDARVESYNMPWPKKNICKLLIATDQDIPDHFNK